MECAGARRVGASEAAASSLLITALYVGCLYLPFNRGARDAPRTIQRRLLTLAVLLALVELYVRRRLLLPRARRPPPRLRAFAVGAALTALLYAGHLVAVPLRHSLRYSLLHRHQRFVALRNYVLGPLLEEICFRRHTLLLWSCHSPALRVLVPAATFALAHVHHVAAVGVRPMCAQLLITFLFGAYAGALRLSTRSLCASFAAHVVCNLLGLPDLHAISAHPRRRLVVAFYCAALVTFAVAFAPVTAMLRPRSAALQ